MSDFEQAFPVLGHDEGSEFVPDDHGRGPSKYGVTLKTLQSVQPTATAEDIQNLTLEQAEAFYRQVFWDAPHIGRIQDQALATKLFDMGANLGSVTAIRILQRCIGVAADGILGDLTASRINNGNPAMILVAFKAALKTYYQNIVELNPDYSPDLAGWLARADA